MRCFIATIITIFDSCQLQLKSGPLIERTDKYSSLLLNKIGGSRFVLIGETSHGTHEFYQARIEIMQQLIEKKNFLAVAIEGDWPDAYRGAPIDWTNYS